MFERIIYAFANFAARTTSGADIIVRAASAQLGGAAYRRLHRMGFKPGGIIDIGAHRGDWTREIRDIFDAPTLMIEARNEELQYLAQTSLDVPRTSYVIALLGSQSCQAVKFALAATGSSMFEEQSNAPRSYQEIPMRRLDDILDGQMVKPPFFLKLDVQGAELEVLRGGASTLRDSELVQLEVPLLAYNKGAPTCVDVINFMDAADFTPFDISGHIRPDGISLAQADIIFVRKTSPLRRGFFQFEF